MSKRKRKSMREYVKDRMKEYMDNMTQYDQWNNPLPDMTIEEVVDDTMMTICMETHYENEYKKHTKKNRK